MISLRRRGGLSTTELLKAADDVVERLSVVKNAMQRSTAILTQHSFHGREGCDDAPIDGSRSLVDDCTKSGVLTMNRPEISAGAREKERVKRVTKQRRVRSFRHGGIHRWPRSGAGTECTRQISLVETSEHSSKLREVRLR
jgi:hypothetical protein